MNRKDVELIRKALNYFETGFNVLQNLLSKEQLKEGMKDMDEDETSYRVDLSDKAKKRGQ